MINLLPKEEIEELKNEENLKIVLNLGSFFLFFLIFVFLVSLSLRFYFFGKLQYLNLLLEGEEKTFNLQLEKEIERYNLLFSRIEKFQTQKVYFFPIFEEILKKIPEKISLDNFHYEKNKDGKISIILEGKAPERKDLLELINNLKERYEKVSFSPEILLRSQNIHFSISVTVK